MTTKELETKVPAARPASSFTDQLIEPLARLRNEVDRLFNDFPVRFPAFRFDEIGTRLTFPAVEMKETDKAFKISIEVPGMEAKDIDLTVAEGALVLKGEKKEEREEKEKDYAYSERSYGSFERRIALPPSADTENVKATAKDGVLKITIGKRDKVAPGERRIAIGG